MVVSFPPKYSIAKVVQILKQNTGKSMKEKFDFLKKRYPERGGIWSRGYFVSTVRVDEKVVRRYVRYQQQEDEGRAKLDF